MKGEDLTGKYREEWDSIKAEMKVEYSKIPIKYALDGYSETILERFIGRMKQYTAEYNDSNKRGYLLDFSWGAYITESDSYGRIEEFLKISDARMYEQKMTKPGRRR